jgi:hypothetical protein
MRLGEGANVSVPRGFTASTHSYGKITGKSRYPAIE